MVRRPTKLEDGGVVAMGGSTYSFLLPSGKEEHIPPCVLHLFSNDAFGCSRALGT